MTTDSNWTHESNLTYHGHPFTYQLAAGDRPSQIVDCKHRVVCTINPMWEPLGDSLACYLNRQAAYRIEYEEHAAAKREAARCDDAMDTPRPET